MSTTLELLLEWGLVVLLVMMSGLFSGLTLGLLGLDLTGLEIIIHGGDPKEAEYARTIYQVRKHGNLLLCTLLLGNVAVNAALAILLASKAGGTTGFFVSTAVIVVFGEIVPQASCSRHALAIGARTVWLVKMFMVLLLVLAWPIAKALDLVLGEELRTQYTRTELKRLLEIQKEEGKLSQQENLILEGALEFNRKSAADVMTPIEHVTMLAVSRILDMRTFTEVLESGHSRIPVFDTNADNIVGLLFVKDLVLLNPSDEIPLRTVLSLYGHTLTWVFPDMSLGELLNEFKKGDCHMAVVHDVVECEDRDNFYRNIGVVTLEDVIEELIQSEIVDETDRFVDKRLTRRVERHSDAAKPSSQELTMSLGPRTAGNQLPPTQLQAVATFLFNSVPEFGEKHLTLEVLRRMLEQCNVLSLSLAANNSKSVLLYERGKPATTCTLVLEGNLQVTSGEEGFVSRSGPFTVLGVNALTRPEYCPDFRAESLEDTKLLRISKQSYVAAVRASVMTRMSPRDLKKKNAVQLVMDEEMEQHLATGGSLDDVGSDVGSDDDDDGGGGAAGGSAAATADVMAADVSLDDIDPGAAGVRAAAAGSGDEALLDAEAGEARRRE